MQVVNVKLDLPTVIAVGALIIDTIACTCN